MWICMYLHMVLMNKHVQSAFIFTSVISMSDSNVHEHEHTHTHIFIYKFLVWRRYVWGTHVQHSPENWPEHGNMRTKSAAVMAHEVDPLTLSRLPSSNHSSREVLNTIIFLLWTKKFTLLIFYSSHIGKRTCSKLWFWIIPVGSDSNLNQLNNSQLRPTSFELLSMRRFCPGLTSFQKWFSLDLYLPSTVAISTPVSGTSIST